MLACVLAVACGAVAPPTGVWLAPKLLYDACEEAIDAKAGLTSDDVAFGFGLLSVALFCMASFKSCLAVFGAFFS